MSVGSKWTQITAQSAYLNRRVSTFCPRATHFSPKFEPILRQREHGADMHDPRPCPSPGPAVGGTLAIPLPSTTNTPSHPVLVAVLISAGWTLPRPRPAPTNLPSRSPPRRLLLQALVDCFHLCHRTPTTMPPPSSPVMLQAWCPLSPVATTVASKPTSLLPGLGETLVSSLAGF